MGNCCSAITLTGSPNTNHEFSICGTVDGDAVSCEIDPTDCSVPIDGLQHSYLVLNTSGTTIHVFCVAPNTGFSISHLNTGTATIVLACQYDLTSSQTLNITFNGIERKQFEVDGDCIVEICE
jgi:hypothetical protein